MNPDDRPHPVLIGETSLDGWEVIGSGGFGQVFKARHSHWFWDVAIKILHYDDGTSSALLREAELMRRGESPYVVRVSGVFKGRLPSGGPSVHLGLVMDYMEQGSLADLQGTLCGPPPWPLAFRLAHQVALGMNFLHNLSPPLLHLDLKPSNVLLDSSLSIKLTDFGLARAYHHSVSLRSRGGSVEEGSTSYMPPEAFSMHYKPTCSSDMYSYGILLWSILTGEKPYPNAFSSLVRLRIPEGDRPTLEAIDPGQAEGLGPLVELMRRCWHSVPRERPSFLECVSVTGRLYGIHKCGINDAVHHVHTLLDKEQNERKLSEGLTKMHVTQHTTSASSVAASMDGSVMDDVTCPPPVQETAGRSTMPNQGLDSGTDTSSSQPMSFSETQRSRPSTYSVPASSVIPNHAPVSDPPPVVTETMHSHGKEEPTKAHFTPTAPGSYQRQISNPEAFQHLHHHQHHPRQQQQQQQQQQHAVVCISNSSITGFLNGDNNYFSMRTVEVPGDRRRHPTAPPSFNTREGPQSGSRQGATGKLG